MPIAEKRLLSVQISFGKSIILMLALSAMVGLVVKSLERNKTSFSASVESIYRDLFGDRKNNKIINKFLGFSTTNNEVSSASMYFSYVDNLNDEIRELDVKIYVVNDGSVVIKCRKIDDPLIVEEIGRMLRQKDFKILVKAE